jgi:hypothetical protein
MARRDDIAIGRHRHLLIVRHDPLARLYHRLEKVMLDKDLHASVKDV